MKTFCVLLLTVVAIGCGYSSKNSMGGSAPVITSLVPDSATVGQQVNLVVMGSNFTSGSTVYWNGTAKAPMSPVMAGQLTVLITSADTMAACSAAPCMVGVHVLTTGGAYGNGVMSNSVPFTVNP